MMFCSNFDGLWDSFIIFMIPQAFKEGGAWMSELIFSVVEVVLEITVVYITVREYLDKKKKNAHDANH